MRYLPLMALAALLSSCRQEEVTRVTVPKSSDAAPTAVPGDRLHWTLPAGWKETAGTGMRLATLTPPDGIKAEGTVVALPGESGSELSNVNRWRGQLGLSPTDEKGMAEGRTSLKTAVGTATLYSFVGGGTPNSRMVAAIVKHADTLWFFKLLGDEGSVNKANGDFIAIIKSLSH